MIARRDAIPRTSETELCRMGAILSRHQVPFVATEKLDGFSFSFGRFNGEFVAANREHMIDPDGYHRSRWCIFVQAIRQLWLNNPLFPENTIFQGELVGPRIRGNRYGLQTLSVFIFDVIMDGVYLNHEGAEELAERFGFAMVPQIAKDFLPNCYHCAELATGPSLLNPKVQMEGAVFRPLQERRDDLHGRVSFKVFNPLYPFHH